MRSFGAAVFGLTLISSPALADFQIQDLSSPNGKSFWLVEEPSIPIVAIEIGFKGGSRLDPREQTGLSKFTMGLMNEGSGDLDAVAFSTRADEISARIGFQSGADKVEVSARFLAETLDDSIDLLALAMAEPRFDAEPIERVRKQILSGIAQDETDPNAIAQKTWWERAFPNHSYGVDSSGTVEQVNSFGPDDFRTAHQRLMTSSNAFITIVGAITPEQAGTLVDKVLAGLPEGEPVQNNPAEDQPPPGIFVVKQDVPQSVAIFGHKGMKRDDPDFFAAYVMNYVLGGGGFSSRLTEEVREKRGLAYSVYSYLSVYDEVELYMGGVQTANERIGESLDVIKAEWARMAAEGLTEEDLQKAKTYLTGSFPLRFDSNSKIANYLLFVQMEDLGIDYINTRNGRVEAVTLEDAKRAAQRLLDPEALSIVVVGDPQGLEATAN
ncbi:MAG: pitrilysin family protein [Pseudomonadota bacterium]